MLLVQFGINITRDVWKFFQIRVIRRLVQSPQNIQTSLVLLISNCARHRMISMGNDTVREVLMKNHTRVWPNVYNTASAKHVRYNKYFAKYKCDFSLILRGQV